MDKFFLNYYTDPVCCWSWGLEPQMRKLRYLLKDKLEIKYIMGGLIRDWDHYKDPINNISKASQMGPLWVEAKHLTGQPFDEHMWVNNPVDTSYPSCMAVKAAGVQSPVAEEAMLRKLREAVMVCKKNIGNIAIIMKIAEDLAGRGLLNISHFQSSFHSNESADLLREDLENIKIKGITRFPTMLITFREKTVQITGYRPFYVLLETFKYLDSSLELSEEIDPEEYYSSWDCITNRELQEVLEK